MENKSAVRRSNAALIIAMVALLAALSGNALGGPGDSATVTKKTVKRIAVRQINRLAPGLSVAHAQSADSAARADQADNAAHANSADTADHANSADSASTVPCPAGTVRAVGVCIEQTARASSNNMYVDQNTCASLGRRLAGHAELRGARVQGLITPGTAEFTSDVFFNAFGADPSTMAITLGDANFERKAENPGAVGDGPTTFRCVAGP